MIVAKSCHTLLHDLTPLFSFPFLFRKLCMSDISKVPSVSGPVCELSCKLFDLKQLFHELILKSGCLYAEALID